MYSVCATSLLSVGGYIQVFVYVHLNTHSSRQRVFQCIKKYFCPYYNYYYYYQHSYNIQIIIQLMKKTTYNNDQYYYYVCSLFYQYYYCCCYNENYVLYVQSLNHLSFYCFPFHYTQMQIKKSIILIQKAIYLNKNLHLINYLKQLGVQYVMESEPTKAWSVLQAGVVYDFF